MTIGATIILVARLCVMAPLGDAPVDCTAVYAMADTDCSAAKSAMRHGSHGRRVTMMTCVRTTSQPWEWPEDKTEFEES